MQEDFRGRNSTEGKRRRALLRVLLASLFLTSGALAQNPKISGVVFFYPSKVKMANVKLTFSGVGDTYTNDVGFYQMEVPSSWSGTLTPSCAGYDFEDSTRTFTNVSSDIQFQDFWEISDPMVKVSGYIKHENNDFPLSGIILNFSNGGGLDTTDANGYYEQTLPYRWNGMVTPVGDGFSFSPAFRTYGELTAFQYDQNYTGSNGPDRILSGHIYFLPGQEPIENVRVTFSNTTDTLYTDTAGYYENRVPFLWSGRITPYKENYQFDPNFRPLTDVSEHLDDQDFWIEGSPVDTISGTVTWGASGPGIAGVTLYYGDSGDSVLTDSLGIYQIEVPYNWSGIVIPAKDSWLFDPDSNSYELVKSNISNENYSILGPDPVLISGTIYSKTGSGVPGVSLFYNGTDSVVTDASGDYVISVPNHWSGTVKPSQANYMFDAVSRTYTEVDTHQVNQDYRVLGPSRVDISGQVRFNGGAGVDSVAIIYGSEADTCYTDANGDFTVTVPFDWSGQIKTEKECYAFTPLTRDYENIRDHISGQDFLVDGTPTAYISGVVRYEPNGPGLPDVVLTYGSGDTVMTNSNGEYSFGVDLGWSGTVTPSKDDLLFDPASRSYSNVQHHRSEQNYAILGPATIHVSGKIFFSPGEEPISGAVVYYGSSGDSVLTDANGQYTFSVPNGWSGYATPQKTGYNFEPSSIPYKELRDHQTDKNYWVEGTPTLTISGTVKNIDDEPESGVALHFGASDSVLTDGSGTYSISVPFAWSGSVTPSKSDLIFAPASKSYSLITLNQTEQNYQVLGPGQIIISGTLYYHPGKEPITGAVLYYGEGDSTTTDSSGEYAFLVQNGWSGTVTPYKTGHLFEPSSRHYYDVNSHYLNDDYWVDGPPTVVISGEVRYKDDRPAADVIIHYTSTDTVMTDSQGEYSISLDHGWSGTVTPELDDLLMDPLSRTYSEVSDNKEQQDYTILGPAIISVWGTVRDPEGQALAQTTITYGSGGDTVMSRSDGSYCFSVANGWSGTVIPVKDSLLFSPVSRTYCDLDTHQVAQDYQALGPAQIIISGKVSFTSGQGVADLVLIYGSAHDTTSTDAQGGYQINVPYGWQGTITPVEGTYLYLPAKRQLGPLADHIGDQDFTAYLASGYKGVVIDDQVVSLYDSMLTAMNIYHLFSDSLPPNLSEFDLVLFSGYSCVRPEMTDRIESYINNGGGVILLGECPIALCNDTLCLASIREWFGSGTASRVAMSNARAVVDKPLGTSIYTGDIVAQVTADSVLGLNHLKTDVIPLTLWETGSDNYHSFVRVQGYGKVGYMSNLTVGLGRSKALLQAMITWIVQANTSVDDGADDRTMPHQLELLPCYPNPFNPSTTITYRLPAVSQARLEIFDIRGRLVKILFDGPADAGSHTITWQADDSRGNQVASGLYICRLISDAQVKMQKMIFTK